MPDDLRIRRVADTIDFGDLLRVDVRENEIGDVALKRLDIAVVAPEAVAAHPHNLAVEGGDRLPRSHATLRAGLLEAVDERAADIDREPRIEIGEEKRAALRHLSAHEPSARLKREASRLVRR